MMMSYCKKLLRRSLPLCYPVRAVRRVKCDERGSNIIMMMLYMCREHKCNCELICMWTHAHVCACGGIRWGVSECPVWMLKGAYTPMYLPPLVLFNPLMGNEWDMNNHFSLNLYLVISLSLSLSLSPLNVEPPWEGGGAILGTTPHPTMLLNAHRNHAITMKHSSSLSLSTFVINPSSLIISIIIANPIPIFITIITNPNPKTYNKS